MRLFKPKWKQPDGSERQGRVWWIDAVVAGKRIRKTLGIRDKHAAQVRAGEIVRQLELQASGVPVDDAGSDSEVKALIESYDQELVRRRSSPQHVARTIQRLNTMLDRASRLSDVTPEYVRKALARVAAEGVTPQTVNAYRVAAHSFFAWLVREDRWSQNPVSKVARVRAGESTRERRALSRKEVEKLAEAAPPHRGACYLLAAMTGLRRSEIASLTWADVDLDAGTVRVRAGAAKNRREAVLPLPDGTVDVLRALRGEKQLPTAPVFRAVPRTTTLRKDLKAAKIAVVTPAGLVDFHALRVTYGTLLARAGVSLAQAQKLMRHSTPALTANIYTRLQMDDARDAVAKIDVGGSKKGKRRPASARRQKAVGA